LNIKKAKKSDLKGGDTFSKRMQTFAA